jgi:toxin ParE1/3/4
VAEKKKREVAVSQQFTEDLKSVYEYGEETFGEAAAKSFVSEIYSKIWVLDETWSHHSEYRHLPTKDQRYRKRILQNSLTESFKTNKTTINPPLSGLQPAD